VIEISIPGYKKFQFVHLALDFNGTLACDGQLLQGVKENLISLADLVQIHVLTADTHGNVRSELSGVPCEIFILPAKGQEIGKLKYVEKLGPERTVCIGNGRNDRLMLKEAALGIVVLQKEGAAREAIIAADVFSPNILAALGLLFYPKRLIATLRS
jgi:soluble P-type ATPase